MHEEWPTEHRMIQVVLHPAMVPSFVAWCREHGILLARDDEIEESQLPTYVAMVRDLA